MRLRGSDTLSGEHRRRSFSSDNDSGVDLQAEKNWGWDRMEAYAEARGGKCMLLVIDEWVLDVTDYAKDHVSRRVLSCPK